MESERADDLRPRSVDTDDPTGVQAIGVGILDVGDVPPELLHAGEGRGSSGDEGEHRPHRVVLSLLGLGWLGAARDEEDGGEKR